MADDENDKNMLGLASDLSLTRSGQTRGERYLRFLDVQLESIEAFASTSFDERDLIGAVVATGASVERYLQLIVPNADGEHHNYFQAASSKLRSDGYVAESNAIDDLRTIYNDTKHKEHYLPSLQKTKNCVKKVRAAIYRLNADRLGSTGLLVFENKSIFWVAASDHYTSGETEIIITLPTEVERLAPLPFDRIIIHGEKWDAYKEELSNSGRIVPAKESMPDWAIEALCEEADSLMPFAYVGEYSSLLKAGAKFEYRAPGLLAPLTRAASTSAMNLAFILACMDASRNHPALSGVLIEQHAIQFAAEKYGFVQGAVESKLLKNARSDFAKLLASLPFAARQQLAGPTWVDNDTFDRLKAVREKYSEPLGVAIGPDLHVILRAHF